MSARPPFEPLPPDPLDREEAALANAYRKLPATEPSPQLDARILAQARAAATPKRRQRRPWFLGAGFGAAAAAVMAAGVAWQLGWIGGIPGAVMAPGTSQRSDARMQAPKDDEATKEERIDIEFVREERELTPARPTADAAAASAVAPPPAVPESPPPQKVAAPPAPPAPAPCTCTCICARDRSRSADADRSCRRFATWCRAPRLEHARTRAVPGTTPEFRRPARSRSAPGCGRERGVGRRPACEGTGWRRPGAGTGPPCEATRRVSTLDRRRTSGPGPMAGAHPRPGRCNGDRQSAEFSLRRFVQVHPQHAVPRELRRLLVE
jgi:hypothetical protein